MQSLRLNSLACRWTLILGILAALGTNARATVGPVVDDYEATVWRQSGTVGSYWQDDRGAMWMGTQGGVYRFDGSEFRQFDVGETSVAGVHIAPARGGGLWIAPGTGLLRVNNAGTDSISIVERGVRGLRHLVNGHVTPVDIAGLQDDFVWTLLNAQDGSLWVGTENGVVHLRNGGGERIGREAGLPSSWILCSAQDNAGDIWLGTSAGLVRLHKGRWRTQSVQGAVVALVQDSSGVMWAGTTQGVWGLRDDVVVRRLTPKEGLPDDFVRSLVVAQDDALWIGTYAGLSRWQAGKLKIFSGAAGAGDDRILALGSDREGGVWIGSRAGGAARMAPRRLWNLGVKEGLVGDATFGLLRRRDGSMWMTSDGGITIWEGGEIRQLRAGSDLPFVHPRSLAEGADGNLWVGTTDGGLLRARIVKGHLRWDQWTLQSGMLDNGIRMLLTDHEGDLWVGWEHGGISHMRPSRAGDAAAPKILQTLTRSNGLCDAVIVTGLESRDGGLWFGTNGGGLARVVNGAVKCFRTQDGLASNVVSSLSEDDSEALWIGTRFDSGITRWKAGHFTTAGPASGLYCDSIAQLLDDGRGNLWSTCGGGVSRIYKPQLNAFLDGSPGRISPLGWGLTEGMRSQEASFGWGPGAAFGQDGSFWAATLLGVTVFADPSAIVKIELPVPTIESVSISGQPAIEAFPVVVKGSVVDLDVRFSVATFQTAPQLSVEHRLEGIDAEWVRGRGPIAHYPRVPKGSYKFRVRVLHADTPTQIRWTSPRSPDSEL